jgi:hypothetical protein
VRANDRERRRPPVRADVFDEHVRTFEPPADDEGAVVFAADQPIEEWLRTRLGLAASSSSRHR